MRINIQSVRFDADQKLIDFIEEKVGKLNQIFEGVISAEVILKLDNDEKGENKITEIRLDVPGNDLIAKKQSKSFEEATDEVVSALKKQLQKHKDRISGN